MRHKSGYAAIIGKPNAGKSTLLNAILGEKISIATSKPQTTRKKILGIHSTEDYQIIFLDTPGIMHPEYLLQNRMLEFVFQSAKDADVILFILDIEADPNGAKAFEDVNVQKVLNENAAPKILLINKIDVSNQGIVEKLSAEVNAKGIFKKVLPISAKNSVNIISVVDSILEFLPEHPKYYTDDQLSDENERFFVSEIIREKVFELYREEIPYSTEVEIEEFAERQGRKDYIRAAIIIERESQKPIIIGDKGSAIKKLGKNAREAIESFLQREVFLELFVKVKEKWRSNSNMLNRFGYKSESNG
ncbi:MAG: GTP-binding protein Era [Ignavibacteria bacterium]|nr:MAG: GTP-binding protein Era [Ignavibacteria bacterium]KAF0161518.1 MAG: GTP-binding protein Era [Ignavibacteria bacterium]